MSTSYTDTLKRIKDAEEASNREVSEKKRALEAELHDMEQVADKSIEIAKSQAELYVTKEVEEARTLAQQEANSLLDSTTKKAEDIASRRLDRKEFRKIIDEILFSEFKSE
jgi:vacuolar-type H+-ATPase subunit H